MLRFHVSPETPFGFIQCAVKPRPSGRGGCQLDALELVDTSSAPDIEWPTPPAVQAR
ncbi:hypothetical protein GT014_02945 [Escherichia coli]|nr:hypothetical protein [Escherichia coli]